MACRRAGAPTSRSPSAVKATTDAVVRLPSLFSITLGVLPSITATQENVVPRSMPITCPLTLPPPPPAAAAANLNKTMTDFIVCNRPLARVFRRIVQSRCVKSDLRFVKCRNVGMAKGLNRSSQHFVKNVD